MSLVCCITNYGLPIIVSDLALTTSEDIIPIDIPVLNKKYHTNDFPYDEKLYSFALKTVVIQNKLWVGATGRVDSIKVLFDSVIDYFLYREVKSETLHEFLQTI